MIKKFKKISNLLYSTLFPMKFMKKIGVSFGDSCRVIGLKTDTFGSEPYLVTLGDHVTVTQGVKFVTHDGGVWVFREKNPEMDIISPIIVGNNSFIGLNSIILPGVKIGNNTIIGAGSVVTKNVPDNSVYAGVPAKLITTTQDYYNKVNLQSDNTKLLSKEEKKRYLLKKYNSN